LLVEDPKHWQRDEQNRSAIEPGPGVRYIHNLHVIDPIAPEKVEDPAYGIDLFGVTRSSDQNLPESGERRAQGCLFRCRHWRGTASSQPDHRRLVRIRAAGRVATWSELHYNSADADCTLALTNHPECDGTESHGAILRRHS